MRLRKLTLFAAVLPLMACETMMASGGTELPPEVDPVAAACVAFKQISWSKHDTDLTILEVKQHNAVWRALCVSDPKS